jgi:predicted HicB family RNase H-like nuclease
MKTKRPSRGGPPLGSQNALRGEVPASKNINIRVTPELMERARAAAKAKKQTFSAWLIELIEREIE